jgi:hypothetical protein
MLPGPDVLIVDAAPPATVLTDTGTLFMAGLSDRGLTTGQVAVDDVVHSLSEWVDKYGALQAYNGNEYATAEAFFAEGGARLYFSRQAGPAAAKATANVPVASSKFTATAKAVGAYGNAIDVAVTGGNVVTVRQNAVVVETSPVLADTAAAQAWARDTSDFIDITPLTTGALANSAAVALAGGADDRTNITDTQRQTAIDRFGKDLGPGQVCMPGDTRTAAHQMLAQHALDKNRFAYGDAPDSSSASTVAAAGAAIRALGKDLARHIQILDPWLIAPGTTAATTRTIPPCGVQAGMAARVDAGGNPNRAVAGRNGISRFASAAKYTRTDDERETLADAGVTVYLSIGGLLQAYDDVTPVDPATDPEWLGAAGNRFVMRVIADALEIARAHMFAQEDGAGVEFSDFNGDLKGMLARWYSDRALYGATAAEAFRVETGPSVNTPQTIAARQLKAAIALKISPNARQVVVQITNTPLTEVL